MLQSIPGLVKSQRPLRESAWNGFFMFGSFSVFWTSLIFFLETPKFNMGAKEAGLFGLVGVAGNLTVKHRDFFTQALYVDVLRGKDSTGVATVKFGGKIDVYKKANAAYDFINTKRYGEVVGASSKILLGHNRAATKGKVVDEAAHPFWIENIVLAHNGTLFSHANLAAGHKFDVDSQAIANHFAVHDHNHGLELLDGAYALTWYNSDANTLNFARNDERPFTFLTAKDGSLLWASERDMLLWLASRNGIKFDDDKVVTTKPGHVYTFQANNIKFEEYETTTFKEYKPVRKKPWWEEAEDYYGRGYIPKKKSKVM